MVTALAGSSRPVVVGIDIGLTAMKAVAFDPEGSVVARASARTPGTVVAAHQVERDGDGFWSAVSAILRELTGAAHLDVSALAVTAHGDGVWLVDECGALVRPGIVSLDTRANGLARQLATGPSRRQFLERTGQLPWPASPGTLLGWLQEHEPDHLDRSRWFLSAKDYVRLRLTGTVGTDATEASASFTDVATQEYSDEAFSLYGIPKCRHMAPDMARPAEVVGEVTAAAAAQTGLRAGTPVVAGLHDVDAAALGAGAASPGQLVVIAGSFSINEVISAAPETDPRWCSRSFVKAGHWLNMAISPASSTNLEWFVRHLAAKDADWAVAHGRDPYGFVDDEIESIHPSDERVTVLPYLYGSPLDVGASAAYVGLRAWHTRGHLLRGIYEGIAFNHRQHIDALLEKFTVTDIRLMGGVARSRVWPQLFADTLGRPIELPRALEPGALGAAMCAAVGVGRYADIDAALGAMGPSITTVMPSTAEHRRSVDAYDRYRQLIASLEPWWAAGGS